MKYFQLMVLADNAVGANFHYVTEKEKDQKVEELQCEPNNIDEISKEVYDYEIERQHTKFMRFVTGYPK